MKYLIDFSDVTERLSKSNLIDESYTLDEVDNCVLPMLSIMIDNAVTSTSLDLDDAADYALNSCFKKLNSFVLANLIRDVLRESDDISKALIHIHDNSGTSSRVSGLRYIGVSRCIADINVPIGAA